MKIIRWVLSHTFLILLIVVVIYGYMFWGNLLGKETPAGKAIAYLSSEFVVVDEFVNAVKAKQTRVQSAETQASGDTVGQVTELEPEASSVEEISAAEPGQETGSPDVGNDIDAASVSGAGTDSGKSTEPSTVTDVSEANDESVVKDNEDVALPAAAFQETTTGQVSNDHRDSSQSTSNQGASNQGTIQRQSSDNEEQQSNEQRLNELQQVKQADTDDVEPVAATVSGSVTGTNVADDAEGFVSPEIKKQLDNVDVTGRVIDEDQKMAEVRDTWITARKSFYQRKYEQSEKSYQDVISNTRDNHDAYGELGNVYFNQGKHKQAAAAYYEAAAILVKKGQVNRARSLVGLLRHLDEPKAIELQQLIESTAS